MAKRVGIIRGGKGKDYNSSVQRGGNLISIIRDSLGHKYNTHDIFIDKDGVWHLNGLEIKPSELSHKVDLVWNESDAGHRNILKILGIPHISKSVFASSFEKSKELLREHMAQVGVELPRHIVLPVYQEDFDGDRARYAIRKAKEVHDKFGAPWVVKSFTPDASMGIHLAKTFNELVAAIEDGVKHEKSIAVEEFISGKIGSVHTVSGFRNEPIYAFPLGKTYGSFNEDEKARLISLAKTLHHHLGSEHYLKSDFVLKNSIVPGGKTRVYLLSVDLSPDLRPGSHLHEVCDQVGAQPHHLVDHFLERVLNG